MGKKAFIAEKPSVAREFANALGAAFQSAKGYMESPEYIVTWCVGHLVALSYPEAYGEQYRRWSFGTLPFIPDTFRYEVINAVKDQFKIVKGLLNRKDVDTIYVCTDSGREGEYIYRLVDQLAGVKGKEKKRVWIDSQTKEEILRGIREALDLSAYDRLSDAAYMRAKVDYLMGINFSRALSLKYADPIKHYLGREKAVVSVGRVMTCVLGIVVQREREIRAFVKTPFYKVVGRFETPAGAFDAEWRVNPDSLFAGSPGLYKDSGFLDQKDAEKLIGALSGAKEGKISLLERKKEVKNPPLLYNLAELQNDCAKLFKISPDQTLGIMQELYEKKLTTYPRTDARVLSSAVAKEIGKNLKGLANHPALGEYAAEALNGEIIGKLAKTRYVNDKQITDHYALIPTGQGLSALGSVSGLHQRVYELVARRFLSIFYPPAVFRRVNLELSVPSGAPAENTGGETRPHQELFRAGFKDLEEAGYLKVAGMPGKDASAEKEEERRTPEGIGSLKKGMAVRPKGFSVKAGETTPPKRYTSGTMILTMENAGQFIEDEELRAQIRGSGIGTSATRAEILNKLVKNGYLKLDKKTQILSPALFGELIYEVVRSSIAALLNPALTASWEKGLAQMEQGSVSAALYMDKLREFITKKTLQVKQAGMDQELKKRFDLVSEYYRTDSAKAGKRHISG